MKIFLTGAGGFLGGTLVDYILKKKNRIVAIEVKSNSETYNAGLEAMRNLYHPYATFVVGEGGMKAEQFLSINPAKLFE